MQFIDRRDAAIQVPVKRSFPLQNRRMSRARAALLLIPALSLAPAIGLAQSSAPPPDVDQALRTRAAEFLQDQKDEKYFEALELVAKDSQKSYFSAQRVKVLGFEIRSADYSENFTKASVTVHIKQRFTMMGQNFDNESDRKDSWQIENGKWVWTMPAKSNVIQTPIGPIEFNPNAAPNDSGTTVPKELSEEKAREAEKSLKVETSLSKKSLEFSAGKAASDEIVFHNGNHGFVTLQIDVLGDASSVAVDQHEFLVPGDKDQTVHVKYTPSANANGLDTKLRLTVVPFEIVYIVPVKMLRPAAN